MPFYSKRPSDAAAALQSKADKLRARRVELEKQLASNRTAAADRQRELERLLIDNVAEHKITEVQALSLDAESRARALQSAIVKLDDEINQLEREATDVVDAREREQLAAELTSKVKAFETASKNFVAAGQALAAATAPLMPHCWEASPLKHLSDALTAELPPSSARVAQLMRDHIAAVLTRLAPLPAKATVAAPAPIVQAPKPAEAAIPTNSAGKPLFEVVDRGPGYRAMIAVSPAA